MNSNPKKIFIVAGEASGDVLGAALIRGLRARTNDAVEFRVIGGEAMAKEGAQSLIPMSELCVMGLVEVLEHLKRLLRLVCWVADQIEEYQPDAVVFVDLPDFNFRVAQLLKKRGTCKAKRLHYVAPTVWAWREGRAKKIAQFLDGLMCLFPFEPKYFTPFKLETEFVGHPLVERAWLEDVDKQKLAQDFRKTYDIPEKAKLIAVMFGSRTGELNAHAPVFMDALRLLKEQEPNLQLIVPTLPHLQFEVMKCLSELKIPAYTLLDADKKWEAMNAVDGALAVSGTVALELAYAGVPHIIAYKTSWLSWAIIKQVVKVKYAHLANIILDKPLVPEYLQKDCTPEKLAAGLLRLMGVSQLKQQQQAGFQLLRRKLGGGEESPSLRAADFVLSMIKN